MRLNFKYKLISDSDLLSEDTIIHEPVDKYTLNTYNLFGYDLPTNMNVLSWGKVINHVDNVLFIEYIKGDHKFILKVEVGPVQNHVLIKDFSFEDHVLLEFTDYSDLSGSFKSLS